MDVSETIHCPSGETSMAGLSEAKVEVDGDKRGDAGGSRGRSLVKWTERRVGLSE